MKCLTLLLLLVSSVSYSQSTSLGFTCTNNPGSPKTCECSGTADCFWMGLSGVCGKDIVLVCDLPPSNKCTCDWDTSKFDGLVSVSAKELKLKASIK